jgi:uncharacterized coiled-coil protein SlyX
MQNQTSVQDPDAGWKPNNRPQSTVALNFMDELNALFNLDENLEILDKTVTEKKQAVNTQAQELEALQKRLREAEERLSQATGSTPPKQRETKDQAYPLTKDTHANNPLAARHPQTMDIPERPHSAHSRASVKV